MQATTIIYKDVELDINYEYSEKEERTHDHPGAAAEVSISEIFYNGAEVTDIYYSLIDFSELETLILKSHE